MKQGYATDETTTKQEVEHPVTVTRPPIRPAQSDADIPGGEVPAHERPPVPKATYQRMGTRK
jgi:hypothetical protein